MDEMPDVCRHLANTNMVRGGGMLFGGQLQPLIGHEVFFGRRDARRAPIRANTTTKRVGKRVQTWADSAEAVRMLKRAHGVPLRPTDRPVDEWGMGGDRG